MALTDKPLAPATSWLSSVRKGKRIIPRRTFLYGPPGIGKSTLASRANKPIIIGTEEGLDDIDCHSLECSSFDKAMQILKELTEAEHEYESLVIDTVDWLEKRIWEQVLDEEKKKSMEDWEYQKGYIKAVVLWDQLIKALQLLHQKKEMAVILVAHSHIKGINLPDVDRYDRYLPRIHKLAIEVVTEWCTEIFFIGTKILTKSSQHFGKRESKAIDGKRVVYTSDEPHHIAKNRIDDLPNEITMEQAEQVLRDGKWKGEK